MSLDGPLTERLALVLLHFLWQGTAVAVGFLALEWVLRMRQASTRYALQLLGLLIMAACPVVTFSLLTPVLSAAEPVPESTPAAAESPLAGDNGPIEHFERRQPEVLALRAQREEPSGGEWLQDVKDWIVLAWLIGVGLMASRLLLGWAWLRWLRRHLEPIREPLRERAAGLCQALRLRLPRIHGCRHVSQAIALGLVRPLILIPLAWLSELPPDMLEAVLAHELAHIRRWDLWVNAFQRLVETVLFYHPAVWWLSRRLRFERELCCDERAATITGNRLRYAETLEQVGRLMVQSSLPHPALSFGGNRMNLLRRVKSVLNPGPAHIFGRAWVAAVFAILILVAVGWLTLSQRVGDINASEKPAGREPPPAPMASKPKSAEPPIYRLLLPPPVDHARLPKDPAYRLKGLFRTSNGRPVTRVNLRLAYDGSPYPSQMMEASGNTFRARFRDEDEGRKAYYQIDAEGFAPTRSPEFVVARTMPNLTINLSPAVFVSVHGSVLDERNKPVAGARIRVGLMVESAIADFSWGPETKTDATGRFTINHLRVGDRFSLRIDKRGTSGGQTKPVSITKPEAISLPSMRVGKASKTLTGVVIDMEDGKPVRGAKVKYAGLGEGAAQAITDAQGRFELRNLPTGEIYLHVLAPGFMLIPHCVRPDVSTAKVGVFREPPRDIEAYNLRVQLRPRDGTELTNARIWLINQDERTAVLVGQFAGNKFELHGGMSLSRKLGKTFAVVVAAEGYAQSRPVSFIARKNPPPLVVELEPARPVRVRGRVVDAQGQPITAVKVGISREILGKVTDEPWFDPEMFSRVPVTGAEGRFEIAGVPPGNRVAVYVNKPGYAGAWSRRVMMVKSQDCVLPDIVLKKATRELAGRVVNEKNQPIAGARVAIRDFGGTKTTADAAGRFRLLAPDVDSFIGVYAPGYQGIFKPLGAGAKDLKFTLSPE